VLFRSVDLSMVRRRALESLGYSSHPKVPEIIQKAAASEDPQWLSSALYAMGRSADGQWADFVIAQLDSQDNEVQFEAIRAAGELEIEEVRDPLIERFEDSVDDPDLRYAIIWSLSQIGGKGLKEKFENLIEKSTDVEEVEWLEKGLDNLELGGDLESMELLDVDPDEKEDEDLEELEELDEYSDADEVDDEEDEE
jgi:HEAT repeat protein